MGVANACLVSQVRHVSDALRDTTGMLAMCIACQASPAKGREDAHRMATASAGKAGRANHAIFVKAPVMEMDANTSVCGTKHAAAMDIVMEMAAAYASKVDRAIIVLNARRDYLVRIVRSFVRQLIPAQTEDGAYGKAHASVATSMLVWTAQAALMAILEINARPSVTTSRPAMRGGGVLALANACAIRV